MARFEAVFDPGEDDRLPEWVVVEWTSDNGKGCRSGSAVWRSYNLSTGEREAHEIAETMNHEWEIALQEACEFDRDFV